ncbi:hypothetical protein B0H14DRAFT_2244606, partial [Mycena olivaceomarginata]
FYNERRGTYQSPAELKMRVYHRLIHIRDERTRPEAVPLVREVAEHLMYELVTSFRVHVQERSRLMTKVSQLWRGRGGQAHGWGDAGNGGCGGREEDVVLVACILERLLGKGTAEDLEN